MPCLKHGWTEHCILNNGKRQSIPAAGAAACFRKDFEPAYPGTLQNHMHVSTRRQLQYLLEMLRDNGENVTFRYIREHVLKGEPIPVERED